MARGSANGIGQGLHGDLTTTGAMCISSLPCARQGGRGVLRLGDITTPCPKCGKPGKIAESLPAMKWHGIPTVLDNAVIHCGCPPGTNRLIAPLERPQTSRVDARSASVPDNAPSTEAQQIKSNGNPTAPFADVGVPANTIVCDHPDQLHEPARYITEEINRNLNHPIVAKIKSLLSYDVGEERRKWLEQPWYTRYRGIPNFHGVAIGNQTAAAALWAKMVGQNQEWDHKPKLRLVFNNAVWHKYGRHTYFYDIWSNIHYGYIGVACGFSDAWLFDGAGLEQIGSDTLRKIENWTDKPGPRRSEDVEGLRAWDDPPDRISIGIGIKLYHQYPNGSLTPEVILDEVLAVSLSDWGSAVETHACYKEKFGGSI